MIKSKDERPSRVEIDLTGPEGNAFFLLGKANGWAKQLGLDFDSIRAEATTGDYENLVDVLEKHFGKYVTFYR